MLRAGMPGSWPRVIVLIPEIVLTPQMVSWFRGRFGDVAAVLHSRLSAGERFDEWRRIRSGKARLVIGARSAVFAPVTDLGLLIIDEEHEPSYQAENNPRYDAREVAALRAKREGASLLLASATPSILSFAKAQRGDYMLLEMLSRVNKHQLAKVSLVDMREELRLGNRGMFSTLLMERLRACIDAGQQAMLFINRRGYAPSVMCRKCGEVLTCTHCDVKLTYHAADRMMHCHYCGMASALPSVCLACGSSYLKPVGAGTQKVEEEFKAFPGCKDNPPGRGYHHRQDAHEQLLNVSAGSPGDVGTHDCQGAGFPAGQPGWRGAGGFNLKPARLSRAESTFHSSPRWRAGQAGQTSRAR